MTEPNKAIMTSDRALPKKAITESDRATDAIAVTYVRTSADDMIDPTSELTESMNSNASDHDSDQERASQSQEGIYTTLVDKKESTTNHLRRLFVMGMDTRITSYRR